MTFIIGVVGFLYLLSRINTLENKVRKLSEGKLPVTAAILARVSEHKEEQVSEAEMEEKPLNLEALSQKVVVEPISHPSKNRDESDINEFAVGSKVLTSIGIIAIFLGVGFFLRYAFENDLINEPMRVFLGIMLGLVMAGIGHALRNKFASYGYGLVGGGIGVIYLSMYAAYAFYNLITAPVAFVFLIAITVGSITMALAYNSLPLVVYSFIGAYIMPFLLPLGESVHAYFLYLVVFNLSVLIIARQKVWPELTGGSLIGTSLLCLKWVFHDGVDVVTFETAFYLAIIFFIYLMTSLINFIMRDRDYKGIDGFLIYAIPILYYLLNLPLIKEKSSLALFTFGIGLFYVIAAVIIRAVLVSVGEINRFTNAMFVIASAFIAGAISIHFEGNSFTLLWALEALAMLAVGHALRSSANRIAAIVLALLTGIRLLIAHMSIAHDAPVLFNPRTLIFAVVGFMFAALWFYYWKFSHEAELKIQEEEKVAGRILGASGLSLTAYLWVTLEMLHGIPAHADLFLPVGWTLLSIVLVAVSFSAKERVYRYVSYAAAVIVGISIFVTEWSLPENFYQPIVNIRFLSVLGFGLFTALLISLMNTHAQDVAEEESSMKNVLLVVANLLAFWGISLDVIDYYNMQIGEGYFTYTNSPVEYLENTKRVVLSVVWLVYAGISLGVGIAKRSTFARLLAIFLFGITIFKIFLYDTANLSDIFRFVSFITLGVILLLVGFAYYRFKDRIEEFVSNK